MTISPAPKDRLKGIKYLVFAPIIILAIWGIISPIKPICPQREIEEAVIIVDAIITLSLVFLTSRPKLSASSLDKLRMFNENPLVQIIIIPKIRTGPARSRF